MQILQSDFLNTTETGREDINNLLQNKKVDKNDIEALIDFAYGADNQYKLVVLNKLVNLDIYDSGAVSTLFNFIHHIFDNDNILLKYFALKLCKQLLKHFIIKEPEEHLSRINLFLINLPKASNKVINAQYSSGNHIKLENSVDKNEFELRNFTTEELTFNKEDFGQIFGFEDDAVENMLFMCCSLAMEYLCDFSMKYRCNLLPLVENFTKVTEKYFTTELQYLQQKRCFMNLTVSTIAFLLITKSPGVSNYINLSLTQFKFVKDGGLYTDEISKENLFVVKKKFLYILIQTQTALTKMYIGSEETLDVTFNLFEEDELKAMFLELLILSKVSDMIMDKLMVKIFLQFKNVTQVSLFEKFLETHVHLLKQSPSALRIQYSMSVCVKAIDFAHNSRYAMNSTWIFKFIHTIVGYMIHTKMAVSAEERNVLSEFFIAPVKLNAEVKDFYAVFVHFKTVDQQFLAKAGAETILKKYSNRFDSWKQLLDLEIFAIVMCLTANKMLLDDLCFQNYNHHNIFKVAYDFFNYDKKYYQGMFQYYFPKILNLFLNHNENHLNNINSINLITTREIFNMLNQMFLSIKTSSYTGYYVVFNNFSLFVDELYSLYTLTNDEFYLTTLFNIPISLGLLVSKCALIKNPMEQGIKLACNESVLAYLDYMVEFDAEGEYIKILENVFILLKYTRDTKILNICNKFTTKHRSNFNRNSYEIQGDEIINDLLINMDSFLIVRNNNEEIEMNFINNRKTVGFISDEELMELFESCDINKRITKENMLFKMIINGYKNVIYKLLVVDKKKDVLVELETIEESEEFFKNNLTSQDKSNKDKLTSHAWENRTCFENILHYALIYNEKEAKKYLHLVKIEKVVEQLIGAVYSKNDLISNRAIAVLLNLTQTVTLKRQQQINLTIACKFKCINTKSNRVFYAVRDLLSNLFVDVDFKSVFTKIFGKDSYRTTNSFLKSVYMYFEYKYNFGPTTDILKDIDTEFLLNNTLKYYVSIYDHVEMFIQHITDKSKFVKFFDFYERMKSKAVVNFNNNIDFEEFLKPIKRFLPSLAVIDGFVDLVAKEDFIETINKNEKISTENANSIEVFRNLLYNSNFKLTSVFIEIFNQQTFYYKVLVYQLLSNLNEIDLTTMEFLIVNETCNELLILNIKKYLIRPEYVNLFVDKIEHKIVRNCFKKYKNYINADDTIRIMINNKIVMVLNSSNNRKVCYYLLEYLMQSNIKFKNTKIVLESYIQVLYTISSCDKLINFYFSSLTDDEKAYVFQNNPYFMYKANPLEDDEDMNVSFNMSDRTNKVEEIDVRGVTVKNFGNSNSLVRTGCELGLFNTEGMDVNENVDVYDEELVKQRNKIEFVCGNVRTDEDVVKFREKTILEEESKEESKEKLTEKIKEKVSKTLTEKVSTKKFNVQEINFMLLNGTDGNANKLNAFLVAAISNRKDYDENMILAVFKVLLSYTNCEIDAFDKIVKNMREDVLKLCLGGNVGNEFVIKNMYKIFYGGSNNNNIVSNIVSNEDAIKLIHLYPSTQIHAHFFTLFPEFIEEYSNEFMRCVTQSNGVVGYDLMQLRELYDFNFNGVDQETVVKFLSLAICGKRVELSTAIKMFYKKYFNSECVDRVVFYYNLLMKSDKFIAVKTIFELILEKDDLYSYYLMIENKKLFYGLVKATANVREIKIIAHKFLIRETNQAYLLLREVLGKVTSRLSSYTKRDFLTLKVMNYDICRRLCKNNLREEEYVNCTLENYSIRDGLPHIPLYAYRVSLSHNFINNFVNYSGTITLDENAWVMAGVLPKCDTFDKSILHLGFLGEMIESKKIKEEFINGRFKMWMNRYPNSEFILYNKWRTYIFNNYSNNKVNSLICKIKCFYAEYLMKNKLYKQAQIVLNDINKLASIELNQNFHKTILDIKCCEMLGEKSTVVDVINSVNVSRYTNEDKSKLYFLRYKNSGDEYFYNLSKSLYVLEEHKVKEMEDLRKLVLAKNEEESNTDNTDHVFNKDSDGYKDIDQSSEYLEEYKGRLVTLVNDLSIEKGRKYMVKLIEVQKVINQKENPENTQNVMGELHALVKNKDKLHWFKENKNESLQMMIEGRHIYSPVVLMNEYDRLRNDYSKIAEIFTYKKIGDKTFMVVLTDGQKKYVKVVEGEETKLRKKLVGMLRGERIAEEDDIVTLNKKISEMNTTGITKCAEIFNEMLGPIAVTLPLNDLIILDKVVHEMENTERFYSGGINEWYMFKNQFIISYTKMFAILLCLNMKPGNVLVDYTGQMYLDEIVKGSEIKLMSEKVQKMIGMDGLNGHLTNKMYRYRTEIKNSDIDVFMKHFGVKGGLFPQDIEKYINEKNIL